MVQKYGTQNSTCVTATSMTLRPVDSEPTGIPFPPHQSKIVKEGVGGEEEEIVKDGGRDINSLVEDVEGKNTQTNSGVYFSI